MAKKATTNSVKRIQALLEKEKRKKEREQRKEERAKRDKADGTQGKREVKTRKKCARLLANAKWSKLDENGKPMKPHYLKQLGEARQKLAIKVANKKAEETKKKKVDGQQAIKKAKQKAREKAAKEKEIQEAKEDEELRKLKIDKKKKKKQMKNKKVSTLDLF